MYCDLLSDLPRFIPDGKFLDPAKVRHAIRELYSLIEKTLVNHLAGELGEPLERHNLTALFEKAKETDPELASDVASVYKQIDIMRQGFLDLLRLYNKHPEFLNRRRVLDPEVRAPLASLADIRRKIQESGGRAPRKPLFFRIRSATRQGEV